MGTYCKSRAEGHPHKPDIFHTDNAQVHGPALTKKAPNLLREVDHNPSNVALCDINELPGFLLITTLLLQIHIVE